ncbi:MAG TPA: orotate phosphoribosyltransferase [Spirochaetaceae bacterium]|nr:orotate phosphoribosyltransferase [Spirochaetaceae bacterium]
MDFFARIEERIEKMDTVLCIGLDPAFSKIDIEKQGKIACARIALEHNLRIIEATSPCAAAFKPNIAFYEALGEPGMTTLRETLKSIPDDIPVIIDAKRGDISNTAEAYAQALFGELGADAVTLSPYMGLDTLEPFLRWKERGVFVLCRTSNPGAGFLQDIMVNNSPLYLEVAKQCAVLPNEVGLVVAGNDLEALRRVRQVAPSAWFLSPGIGAQGGQADQAFSVGARGDGKGILVVVARAIADASEPFEAACRLRDLMRKARDVRLKVSVRVENAPPTDTMNRDTMNEELLSLKHEFVHALLSTKCFRLGEFILKSGKTSPFYIDLRRLIADPRAMKLAGRAYVVLASNCTYDCIAGIPAAGLPLATAASLETQKPMIWPRMPVKEHGTGNRIEGNYSAGECALLLDDLITTGASKLEAIDILRSEGLRVEDLVVLIERGKEGRRDMERTGVRLHAFIHVLELFDVLRQSGEIDADQYQKFVEFVTDV